MEKDNPIDSNDTNFNNVNRNDINRNNFLYPSSRYHGKFTPGNLVFNANLQEFAQRVSFVCALETGGKMSSADAYQEVKRLYKQLKKSKKELGIGTEPST